MTLVMVCSLLPVSVLATGNTYDDKDEAAAATGVTANKTVSKNDDGTYTVTLSVTGTSEDNPETINHPRISCWLLTIPAVWTTGFLRNVRRSLIFLTKNGIRL